MAGHSTRLNLTGTTGVPRTDILAAGSFGRFLVLNLDADLSFILPGVNTEAAVYARTLAAALTDAADRLEAELKAVA
jgi:hypothetical protein